MPARNGDLEYDILLVFHENEDPLTSMQVAERLKPQYVNRYSSWVSFKNFVIRKLNWFYERSILELDGDRYSHDQRWFLTDLGDYYYVAMTGLKNQQEKNG